MSLFQEATRKQVRLRMALDGPPGAGKTFTALRFATALVKHFGGRIAVINTESGAIEKYIGLAPDGDPFKFNIHTLKEFPPTSYTSALQAAGEEGFTVVVIDSISHAWEGEGGALDQIDRKAGNGNKFTAWKDVTPQHRRMIEAILRSPCHVIVTMRTKMEYVLEEDERGKKIPRKIGLKPVQREGMEYEFDIVADLDELHLLKVSKTRCPDIDNLRVVKPGSEFMAPVIKWLTDGSEVDPSHFATTDADLDAIRNRDRRVAAQEPPKKVDYLKQLTGGAASTPGSTAAPPVGQGQETQTPTPPAGEPKATENQIAHIKGLFDQCEIPIEAARGIIAKRGVTSIADLTEKQAAILIDRLLSEHKRVVQARRDEQDDADVRASNAKSTVTDEEVRF